MSEMMGIFMLCTMTLYGCSVLLSLVFLFMSYNEKYEKECSRLLRYIRVSALLSIVSPFVTFLFGSYDTLYQTAETLYGFYNLFVVASVFLLVLCIFAYIGALLLNKNTAAMRKQRRRFYASQFAVFLLCIVPSWVFSMSWMDW